MKRDRPKCAIADPEVTAIIEKYRRQKGIEPRKVSAQEIVERCIYALVNEGAQDRRGRHCCSAAPDIDIVVPLNGYGFPPWRGGPMFYADQTGLSEVARALRQIAAQPRADKTFWTPAPLLARLAEEGKTFSAYKGPVK